MAIPTHASITADLREAGCVFAEDEATLLIAAAGTADQLRTMVRRRAQGTPLEQVIGWAELAGVRIAVREGVFIPRHRSELLVREAVARTRRGSTVVDLCCGTGAIGAALAAAVPGIELHATEIDPGAVQAARANLTPIGAHVHLGDLFDGLSDSLKGRVDVAVANPPYVPSAEIDLLPREARLYEPLHALDGGPDGLDVVRRIAVSAPRWLAPGGHLLVELSQDQAPQAVWMLEEIGFAATRVFDADLEATVVVARWLEPGGNARRRSRAQSGAR
jgi:release factor glutamine methyltransferase